MKMASRSIDLISKKKNLDVQRAFFAFLCRCFTRLQCRLYRLRRQTSYLHIIFWRSCRTYLPKILFPEITFAFIFSLPLIFTWPLAFLIFFTAVMKFSCFSSNEIPLLCFRLLALALSDLCYSPECKHQN